MKRPARFFFALSATAAASVIVVAIVFALGPNAQPDQAADEIALVRVETLRTNEVVRLKVKELSGVDRLANAEREKTHVTLWAPRSRPDGMPIFVVSTGDGVHAFLGVDPRTGCDLEDKTGGGTVVDQVTFTDVCHGTVYDLSGRPTRGPGLWFLDELVLHVRAGVVYAKPHHVVAGGLAVPSY